MSEFTYERTPCGTQIGVRGKDGKVVALLQFSDLSILNAGPTTLDRILSDALCRLTGSAEGGMH